MVYSCEYCDTKAKIESGPMGGGGQPQNWFTINQMGTQLWFDTWACVAAYAEGQASEADAAE